MIEVREWDATYGHLVFPFIADGFDIVFPKSYLNGQILRNWSNAIGLRLDYTTLRFQGRTQTVDLAYIRSSHFGFRENLESISEKEMETRKQYFKAGIYILTVP